MCFLMHGQNFLYKVPLSFFIPAFMEINIMKLTQQKNLVWGHFLKLQSHFKMYIYYVLEAIMLI